ncbi:hypothetical protein, partial [Alcanivorax sp. P2S70]|uniref:hypothetical protein n=1 Tax=Alcanivorax sp. P2S70 TaxID=1397527 RepID=UPI001F351337
CNKILITQKNLRFEVNPDRLSPYSLKHKFAVSPYRHSALRAKGSQQAIRFQPGRAGLLANHRQATPENAPCLPHPHRSPRADPHGTSHDKALLKIQYGLV